MKKLLSSNKETNKMANNTLENKIQAYETEVKKIPLTEAERKLEMYKRVKNNIEIVRRMSNKYFIDYRNPQLRLTPDYYLEDNFETSEIKTIALSRQEYMNREMSRDTVLERLKDRKYYMKKCSYTQESRDKIDSMIKEIKQTPYQRQPILEYLKNLF